MDNYTKIYWLTRLDYIHSGFVIIAMAAFILFFFMFLSIRIERQKLPNLKHVLPPLIALIISSLVIVFLPTKDDMIMIYAGGKAMNFVQSDTSLNKMPAQTTKLISDLLDKEINELNQKE